MEKIMAKFCSIIAIIAITIVWVVAEPTRLTQSRRLSSLKLQDNNKLFARQEQSEDAAHSSAPYPPSGVTPEIPFDLPTETEAPLAAPDQAYGPPKPTYLPPVPSPATPDQTYGLPKEEDIPAITDAGSNYSPSITDNHHAIDEPLVEELPLSESNLVSENLIQPRNEFGAPSQSASLRSRTSAQRFRSSALNLGNLVRSEPVLYYTLH